MQPTIEIAFDCLPLRTVGRLDAPLDASPKFRARCERIQAAIQHHGRHNSYYLYNAHCRFQLTNDVDVGMLEFLFRGVVLTDPSDQHTELCDLQVELTRETCDWLNEPAVAFFHQTVRRAVAVEFDRYIKAGDLAQTIKRLEQLQSHCDEAGGYMGMFL
jgi:hypothetical protein